MIRGPRIAALLLVLVAAAAGLAFETGSAGQPSPGSSRQARPNATQKLLLDEQFTGSRLDHSRWSACFWWATGGCTIASNHELEWYLPTQVKLDQGIARLIAARHNIIGSDGIAYRFVSGMISSGPPPGSRQPRFAFRYGRVEARIRIPAGRGLTSALWLLPANRSDLPEIDAFEITGQAPGIVSMHLHYARPDGSEAAPGSDWHTRSLAGSWHLFGIDWRPGRLQWLVDGAVRWQVSGRAVPSVPMYLLANLVVGGDEAGPPDAGTSFPSALEIDWIRVWQ